MNIHKNALMTPKIEPIWLEKLIELGPGGGAAALLDRSSRPHRSPKRSCPSKIERAVALRRNQR